MACVLEIDLEETDVPGASLAKPVEQCTNAVLKRWLACRGAKVTGKRVDLVARFVYIDVTVILEYVHRSSIFDISLTLNLCSFPKYL